MTLRATGKFEIKLVRQTQDGELDDPSLARLSIDKQFEGDLQGTSRGQMMSAHTGVENSAGYVALERISGTLHGRSGTFVLQHSSTLARCVAVQSITVVPDSGSGELVGLEGRMTIQILDGKHFYELESTLSKDF